MTATEKKLAAQKRRGDFLVSVMERIDSKIGAQHMRTHKSKIDIDPTDDRLVEELAEHLGLDDDGKERLRSFFKDKDDDDDDKDSKQNRALKALIAEKLDFIKNPPITPAIFTASPAVNKEKGLKRVDGGAFGIRYFNQN